MVHPFLKTETHLSRISTEETTIHFLTSGLSKVFGDVFMASSTPKILQNPGSLKQLALVALNARSLPRSVAGKASWTKASKTSALSISFLPIFQTYQKQQNIGAWKPWKLWIEELTYPIGATLIISDSNKQKFKNLTENCEALWTAGTRIIDHVVKKDGQTHRWCVGDHFQVLLHRFLCW